MMKKCLLICGWLSAALVLNAQTVIFSDDFESYTAGTGIAAQGSENGWQLWNANNPGFDALVSTDQANSGDNAIHLLQTTNDDIVFDVGTPLTSGLYDVKFKMFIESGKEGYFNLMHSWALNSTNMYEWALDVFFGADGSIQWVTAATPGGIGSFNHDEWFEMQITIDFDNDVAALLHNGNELHNFQWSLNNANGAPGINALKVVNFFAYGPSETNGDYYIDDFEIIQLSEPTIVSERNAQSFRLYPNPANTSLTVDFSDQESRLVRIFGTDGALIEERQSEQRNQLQFDTGHLATGLYFIEVIDQNGARTTKRLVVHH